MSRSARLLALPLALVVSVGGCQTDGRATHMIERSGDRAMRQADYAFAAAEYREAVNQRPGKWETRVKLAEALLAGDRPAFAREQLEIAYTQRPTNTRVLDLLAESMLRSGDTEAMTRELRFAAEESGDAADWYRLGVFLTRAGDDDAAETALRTAARLDGGNDAAFQIGLANFYRSVGDEERSLERLRMALFLDQANEGVRSAIREMGHVPGPTYGLVPRERSESLGG
ncbi:MAG: hypothetical protein AAGH64_03550 [Planctomycetota bacterium]